MLRKLSNGTIFNDLERPLTQISRSRHELTLNISEMLRDTDIVTSWADAKRFFQMHFDFNPLMGTLKQQGNGPLYDCTAIWWLLHKPLMAGLLHLVQQGLATEGSGPAVVPPSPLFAVPNVTAHPSTASVPITVLLCVPTIRCGRIQYVKHSKMLSRKACRLIADNVFMRVI